MPKKKSARPPQGENGLPPFLADFEREAREFVWTDREEDLRQIEDILHHTAPDGKFKLIEDYYLPKDPRKKGWVTFSKTIQEIAKYLNTKYGDKYGLVVLHKVFQHLGIFQTPQN